MTFGERMIHWLVFLTLAHSRSATYPGQFPLQQAVMLGSRTVAVVHLDGCASVSEDDLSIFSGMQRMDLSRQYRSCFKLSDAVHSFNLYCTPPLPSRTTTTTCVLTVFDLQRRGWRVSNCSGFQRRSPSNTY